MAVNHFRLFFLNVFFILSDYTSELADTACGTRLYEAPEVMLGEKYNNMADIWSIGVCLYEMISFEKPFSIPAEIMKYGINMFNYKPLPTKNHPMLVPLVDQMLNKDQGSRPYAVVLLKKISNFINFINNVKLEDEEILMITTKGEGAEFQGTQKYEYFTLRKNLF